MRTPTLSLAAAFLVLALPLGSSAATLQILSSQRSVTASAYATDDVIVLTDDDADSTFATQPYSKTVTANLLLGAITCEALGSQTSALAASALHAEGAHSGYAEDTGKTGFGTAGGSSSFHVVFRLSESSGYALDGFVEAFDLGWTTITFSGPGGSILSLMAGGGQHLPVERSGVLPAGDYDLNVSTSGTAHGWPPFPSYASGTYEIHLALDSATDAPHAVAPRLTAFPNPFRFVTRISLPDGARGVRVLDAGGRLVRLFQGSDVQEWDGRDEHGIPAPAGVYFIHAEKAPAASSLKLVRLR